jgi:hypothetical protein
MARSTDGLFGYYINLDERGTFYADVRSIEGETVFDIRCEGDDQWIFDDGWMSDKLDLDGLTSYLVDLDVLPHGAEILLSTEFEERLEAEEDDDLELDC